MRILLLEDNLELGKNLSKKLSKNYIVDWKKDGTEGLYQATIDDYCLIILDVGLPSLNGLEICRELRKREIITPVLFLSGYNSTKDKITGLDMGADDYLPKPFDLTELFSRINALLRRPPTLLPNIIQNGALYLDPTTQEVFYKNKLIKLNHKEYLLLKYLLYHQGKIITKNMIWSHVWENSHQLSSNVIDVYINKLRNKIDKQFGVKIIYTVHKTGFIIKKTTSSSLSIPESTSHIPF